MDSKSLSPNSQPSQIATSSKTNLPLSKSNSRVHFSVAAPRDGAFKPGDVLHPLIELIKGSTDYTSLKLTLVAQTHALIYGKGRWQAGQIASAGFGGGGGMIITSLELLPFVELDAPLVGPPTSEATRAATEKKGHGSNAIDGLSGGTYEVTIPHLPSGDIVPSMKRIESNLLPNRIGVSWVLHLRGKRHGLLKLDDHLEIEIPVGLPVSPPIDEHLPEEQWPVATFSKDLKYKAADGGKPISLEVKLSVRPLAHSLSKIAFRAVITPSDPSALSLLSPSPKVSVTLNQRTTTVPIANPGAGQPFDWAGTIVTKAELPPTVEPNKQKCVWEWAGEMPVPENCVTIVSEGLTIKYFLAAQVVSDSILDHHQIIVNVPVFLPSYPRSLSSAEAGSVGSSKEAPVSGPSHAGGPSAQAGEQLPSYSVS